MKFDVNAEITVKQVPQRLGSPIYHVYLGQMKIASVRADFKSKWEYRCGLPGFSRNTFTIDWPDKAQALAEQRVQKFFEYINKEREE